MPTPSGGGVHTLINDNINDISTSTNSTWSSNKINESITNTKTELNQSIESSVNSAKTELSSDYNSKIKSAAPDNLLDNSDFKNPVNQRNVTDGNIGAQYFIDRWIFDGVGDTRGYKLVNNAITFGAGTWLKQKLPFSKSRMHNKRFTLAVWLTDDQIWCQSFTATAEDSYVTAPWAYQGIGSYYDGSCWTITIANLPNCTVKHVGLFDGEYTADTLPEYRSKGYGAELAECQRYYRDIYLRGAVGFISDADKAIFNLGFVKMRLAVPTVQVIVGDNLVTKEGYFPVLSEGAYFEGSNNVVLKVSNSLNLSKFYPVGAFFGHIALSADL